MKKSVTKMSSETNGMRVISVSGKSKIKLTDEKSIKNVCSRPQSFDELEWINHEILIDDVNMEESSMNGALKSGNTTKIKRKMIQLALPPMKSDHDYSLSNSKGDTSLLTLRKDLFCDKSDKRKLNAAIDHLEAMPLNKSVKTISEATVLRKQKSKSETNSKLKSKPNVFAVADSTNISDNCKNGIIDLAITSSLPEHSSNLPVLLKKVDPKVVPLEIKARTLLKSNMNLPSNCAVSQVVLKHKQSPSKVVSSKRFSIVNKQEYDGKNKTNINSIDMSQELKQTFGENSSDKRASLDNLVKKVLLEEKNIDAFKNETVIQSDSQEQVDFLGKSIVKQSKEVIEKSLETESGNVKSERPEQIKEFVANTVSTQNPNSSKVDVSDNAKKIQQFDISEVRLSSLANVSQGSTTQSSTVLGDEMKPSTSNNIDLTKDMSDDEDSDEELGLNSLEELQQFWEFLVELHDYNKQVIRAQQNKKRRYMLKINKLQHELRQSFGIELESFEEENDESSDESEKDDIARTEEGNLIEKKNESMEEE